MLIYNDDESDDDESDDDDDDVRQSWMRTEICWK